MPPPSPPGRGPVGGFFFSFLLPAWAALSPPPPGGVFPSFPPLQPPGSPPGVFSAPHVGGAGGAPGKNWGVLRLRGLPRPPLFRGERKAPPPPWEPPWVPTTPPRGMGPYVSVGGKITQKHRPPDPPWALGVNKKKKKTKSFPQQSGGGKPGTTTTPTRNWVPGWGQTQAKKETWAPPPGSGRRFSPPRARVPPHPPRGKKMKNLGPGGVGRFSWGEDRPPLHQNQAPSFNVGGPPGPDKKHPGKKKQKKYHASTLGCPPPPPGTRPPPPPPPFAPLPPLVCS